ncbi:hypothetical protein [Bacillus cereus]|uniref:Uncharacterized protein n=1 Tax=Bacillus cereus TaxID=1396 RepID=A0AA44TF57_BACCE|nr:hypothetical protein [Bacillus cereus]PFN08264.1 hypothetical protein COJ55_06990 [Bacillus cereus]PFS02707.1 hypothetical protein COK38_09090 [Bacillus cereus]
MTELNQKAAKEAANKRRQEAAKKARAAMKPAKPIYEEDIEKALSMDTKPMQQQQKPQQTQQPDLIEIELKNGAKIKVTLEQLPIVLAAMGY